MTQTESSFARPSQGIFRHQVQAFGTTHRVVTYDLAGFGNSDPALWQADRHHQPDGHAADMVHLIDDLDSRHLTLLGND